MTPGEILLEAQRIAEEARREILMVKQELRVSDEIIADRNRLLALFECPAHGAGCIPFAIQEVARLRHEIAVLKTIIMTDSSDISRPAS